MNNVPISDTALHVLMAMNRHGFVDDETVKMLLASDPADVPRPLRRRKGRR